MQRALILIPLLLIYTLPFLQAGCRHEGNPSHPQQLDKENKKLTVDVTVGGKVWNINPDLSYRAIGVWTNPAPRPLTDKEKARIQTIKDEIQTLQTKLGELDKELGYLERIEKPQIKIRYRFGKPSYPLPKPSDFPSDTVIDLGEFQMEMEFPSKISETQ